MPHLDWLIEILDRNRGRDFMIYEDRTYTYAWLVDALHDCTRWLDEQRVGTGVIAALRGDYSPHLIAAVLSLVDRPAIVVPLSPAIAAREAEFLRIAEARLVLSFRNDGVRELEWLGTEPANPLSMGLIRQVHPGLVLFSSGSTGASKAALHDFDRLLEKFKTPRRGMVTLSFLMIDHIGGINTLLHVLANAGTLVTSPSRDPDVICATIARHKVELLPTSPTFLNLLLLSEAYRNYDLSSLRLITYGTEPMPQWTLERISALFPNATLQQTYGLSELGILRSKSERSDSLWVKVGGEGFELRVKDGTLWIRARTAMLGYLNAPSPFDSEGWFNTGDRVDVQGEYVRFLGRESEIINVGGQKVYPSEVENVLLEVPNVRDVTVSGQPNLILGNVVTARFNLIEPEDPSCFRQRVREFCRTRLESFKIPARIEIVEADQFSLRFKKMRRSLP
jgi:acyl-CoA synthetase (AMP-forming)/AMP-acid ligase II